jgi:hypothetical protein
MPSNPRISWTGAHRQESAGAKTGAPLTIELRFARDVVEKLHTRTDWENGDL